MLPYRNLLSIIELIPTWSREKLCTFVQIERLWAHMHTVFQKIYLKIVTSCLILKPLGTLLKQKNDTKRTPHPITSKHRIQGLEWMCLIRFKGQG